MSLRAHYRADLKELRTKAQNIVVVRPGALGDTILTIPLIRSIQEKHPAAKITLLGNSAYSSILPSDIAFENLDSMKFSSLFQVNGAEMLPAKITPPDLIFLIVKSPEPLRSNLQAWTNGPVIWIDSAPKSGIHMVDLFHSQIGLPAPKKAPCLLHIKPETKINAAWLHPGSGGKGKCLDLSFFIELSARIHGEFGMKTFFSVGYADHFLKKHPKWPLIEEMEWISILDDLSLDQLCALLGGARYFVGNDSGISHFAANLGIPGAVFFKETDPRIWRPWVSREQMTTIEPFAGSCGRDWIEEVIILIKQIVKNNF